MESEVSRTCTGTSTCNAPFCSDCMADGLMETTSPLIFSGDPGALNEHLIPRLNSRYTRLRHIQFCPQFREILHHNGSLRGIVQTVRLKIHSCNSPIDGTGILRRGCQLHALLPEAGIGQQTFQRGGLRVFQVAFKKIRCQFR